MTVESFPQIMSALEKTEAGQSLKNQYRWSAQFRTDETDEEWMRIFGQTGQVFTHLKLFYALADRFRKEEPGYFESSEDEELFLNGIGPHDFGEAKFNGKGNGDISAVVKTQKDEREETKIAHEVINLIDIPTKTKARLNYAYDQVIDGKNERLNYAFKALERTEYVITAMKVYQNSKRLESEGKKGLTLLPALVGRVLVIDLTKVLDNYVPEFTDSISAFFEDNAATIDEMYAFAKPWLLENKTWKGKDIDHPFLAKQFETKWNKFKSANGLEV